MDFSAEDAARLEDEKAKRYQFNPKPGWCDPGKLMPWLDQPRPCKITISDHVILEDKAEEV